MEASDLLTSLAKLETSLKEIESAKSQVKQTVDAYDILQKQISDYTQSLDSIKGSIQAIISDLQSQRASLGEEASGLTASLEAKANQLFAQLSESSQNSLDTLKGNLATINEVFSREGKSITDSFKKNTDDELAELKTIIQSLKDCAQTLLTLDESIKNTLTEINQMRQEVAELKQALMDSQGSQDTVLNIIQDSINALSQKDEQAFSDLSKSLESSSKNSVTILNGIQDNLNALAQKLQDVFSELKGKMDSSKEEQISLLNNIKEGVKSLSEHQEQAASELSKKYDSIKDSQASSFASMEILFKSNAEKLELLGKNSSKESRLVKVLLISNITLVVIIGLLLFFLK